MSSPVAGWNKTVAAPARDACLSQAQLLHFVEHPAIPLVFWSSSSPNAQVASNTIITDIEAQLPAAPTPAHTTTSSRPPSASYDPEDDCTDAIDDFFGVTYTREERRARRLAQQAQAATHASRHDAPVYVPETQTTDEKEPPSYDSDKESDCATVVAVLPSYADSVPTPTSVFDSDESDEPWTIPQGFFRYGFCMSFPLFVLKIILTYDTYSLPSSLVPRRLPPDQLPLP